MTMINDRQQVRATEPLSLRMADSSSSGRQYVEP